MARLPELTDRDALPEDAHAAYDSIAASRGRVGGLFAVLMNSPEIAGRTAHFGTYIRFEKSLPQPVHELAMIVGAHECEGALEWRAHSRAAREAGVGEATIAAIEHDGALDGLPELDARIVRFGRSLLRDHRVDDADFAALRAELGDRGIVDLVATIGYQALLGCILNGLDIQPAS
ncbi:MAG: carboxymuconolactone decarboxylase family protein [Dehalococcoidia bacterium]